MHKRINKTVGRAVQRKADNLVFFFNGTATKKCRNNLPDREMQW